MRLLGFLAMVCGGLLFLVAVDISAAMTLRKNANLTFDVKSSKLAPTGGQDPQSTASVLQWVAPVLIGLAGIGLFWWGDSIRSKSMRTSSQQAQQAHGQAASAEDGQDQ